MRKLLMAVFLLCSCRPTLRPDFVKVLALLGKPAGVDAGDCKPAEKVKAAYAAEVGKAPLAQALLPFAQAVAAMCPESRPFIRTEGDVELKTVAAMIGAAAFPGDGRMQLEPWLWLRVAGGKVIGVELELGEL